MATGTIKKASIGIEDITNSVTFTRSSGHGTLKVDSAYRWGNIVALKLLYTSGNSSTSAGSNAWAGTYSISGLNVIPSSGFTGAFAGSTLMTFVLANNNEFYIRPISGSFSSNTSTSNTMLVMVEDA